MHNFLFALLGVLAVIVLVNIRYIGSLAFVLLLMGVDWCLSNSGKLLGASITAPFRLAWWVFCLPFRLFGKIFEGITGIRTSRYDVKYFFQDIWRSLFRGDISVRIAKVCTVAFVLALIAYQILKYVPTNR